MISELIYSSGFFYVFFIYRMWERILDCIIHIICLTNKKLKYLKKKFDGFTTINWFCLYTKSKYWNIKFYWRSFSEDHKLCKNGNYWFIYKLLLMNRADSICTTNRQQC